MRGPRRRRGERCRCSFIVRHGSAASLERAGSADAGRERGCGPSRRPGLPLPHARRVAVRALEPLLPRVSKPIQYVGGELNAVVKDWDARRRALGADVPRRLRGRPAQPGRADPLRGPQRARRRAGRAHLRGVARPRGADARARRAAVHRRRAPAGRAPSTCSASRFSTELGYTNMLTALDLAGIPLHAADRDRRRTRSSSPAGTPRSTPSRSPTSSTPRCSATASRRCCEITDIVARLEGATGARAAATSCCCGWRAPAASTCRAFYDVDYLPDGRIQRGRARTAPGVPWRVAKHTVMDLDAVALPEAAARAAGRDRARADVSVEIFRGCTRGCRFCQAGMITRPVRERSHHRRSARWSSDGLRGHRLRGGRACCRCPAPTTPRSPTIAKGLADRYEGTQTSACRCRRPASTRSTSTSPTSCPATAAAPA